MRQVTYKTKDEREVLIKDAESKREIMKHDDYIDPDNGIWRLTFVTESEMPATVKHKDTTTLVNEAIDALTAGDKATCKDKLYQLFGAKQREALSNE